MQNKHNFGTYRSVYTPILAGEWAFNSNINCFKMSALHPNLGISFRFSEDKRSQFLAFKDVKDQTILLRRRQRI